MTASAADAANAVPTQTAIRLGIANSTPTIRLTTMPLTAHSPAAPYASYSEAPNALRSRRPSPSAETVGHDVENAEKRIRQDREVEGGVAIPRVSPSEQPAAHHDLESMARVPFLQVCAPRAPQAVLRRECRARFLRHPDLIANRGRRVRDVRRPKAGDLVGVQRPGNRVCLADHSRADEPRQRGLERAHAFVGRSDHHVAQLRNLVVADQVAHCGSGHEHLECGDATPPIRGSNS